MYMYMHVHVLHCLTWRRQIKATTCTCIKKMSVYRTNPFLTCSSDVHVQYWLPVQNGSPFLQISH